MKKKNIIILGLAVLTIAGSIFAADADSSIVVTRSMSARERKVKDAKGVLLSLEKDAQEMSTRLARMKSERDPIIERMRNYEKGLYLPHAVTYEQDGQKLKNLQARIDQQKKEIAALAASKISAVYDVQEEQPVFCPRAGSMAKLMLAASKASVSETEKVVKAADGLLVDGKLKKERPVAGTSLKRSNAFGASDRKHSRKTVTE